MNDTLTLFRPVGPQELELIHISGYRAFPARLPGQPIFYPVLNMNYAVQIARDWNMRDAGAGYVTRFRVRTDFILRYPVQTVGDGIHQELWIPAEELPAPGAYLKNRPAMGLRARRAGWRGATKEHIRENSVTEEQRRQPACPRRKTARNIFQARSLRKHRRRD